MVAADWWAQGKGSLHETLATVFRAVRDENAWRTDKDEHHWGLYEGTGLGGVTTTSRRNMTYASATLPDNVVKQSVDTLQAKVATVRPVPAVFAKGDFRSHRRARKVRQVVEGEFSRLKIHDRVGPAGIKDALVARAGIVHVYVDGRARRPKVERVHPWTLFVDDWDAEFGEPQTLMRLRTMNRENALRKFGRTRELRDALKTAERFSGWDYRADEDRASTVERVELVEAWHRCCGHEDDDEDHECVGRHVIVCHGAVLFDEPWPHDWFPFAKLEYDTPNTGWWGSSLAQSLEGYQFEVNKTNERLSEMYENSGKLVILRDGSGVFNQQVTNGLNILNCKFGAGYEPIVADMDLVNEHARQRVPELIGRGLNSAGVSQMAAYSQKPAGDISGVALQTLDDVESQRHIVFSRKYEAWCRDIAFLIVEAIKKIAAEHGDYAVDVPLRGRWLPLRWKDVEVDGFTLEIQNVSSLYHSVTGRMDRLQKFFEAGLIEASDFKRQMVGGDFDAELALEAAPYIAVDEMIERLLDSDAETEEEADEDYIAPNSSLPLKWAHKRTQLRLIQAEMDDAPQAVLDLLGRFRDDLQFLIERERAANAPPPAPAGAPPPPDGGMPVGPPMDVPLADAPPTPMAPAA